MRLNVFCVTLRILASVTGTVHGQNTYHYEISSVRRNSAFVIVEYQDPTKVSSDVIELSAYCEDRPCKNFKVTIYCKGDSLTGRTDSLGHFYFNRSWHWPWPYITVKIQHANGGTRVLPMEETIEPWGWRDGKEIPVRMTAMLEPRNIYIMQILSRKQLDKNQLEKIRNKIQRNPNRRPRIRGIDYFYGGYL